jgi:Tfp pilus assembly PilM family ATPase
MEIEKITRHFFQIEGKEAEEVILAGGAANLRGIKEYFAQKLKNHLLRWRFTNRETAYQYQNNNE